jgi:predicted nucleic acid-binding protein
VSRKLKKIYDLGEKFANICRKAVEEENINKLANLKLSLCDSMNNKSQSNKGENMLQI